jgi:hypothetical protein
MFQFSILTQPSTSAVARLENGEKKKMGKRERVTGKKAKATLIQTTNQHVLHDRNVSEAPASATFNP